MRKNEIKVSKEEFKKIRRGKQTLVLRLYKEEFSGIKEKSKIIIKSRIDRFVKKVKRIHIFSDKKTFKDNFDKLKLGYRRKDSIDYSDILKDYTEEDIKKYGIIGIELEPKKHIFRKLLLGILIIILTFFTYSFINKKLDDLRTEKIIKKIDKISKEKIDYVFLEINPSLVLTVQDNKVKDVACLNNDCLSIYNDLTIKDNNINDSIKIIYEISKEKGFDVSNGVKIKTSSNTVNIQEEDYIDVEYIDTEQENELLTKLENNENIKSFSNENYYATLWEELKNDDDYDKVYTCNMENNKLNCYFTKDFINLGEKYCIGDNIDVLQCFKYSLQQEKDLQKTLNKFKVKYDTEKIDYSLLPALSSSLDRSIDKIFLNNKWFDFVGYQCGRVDIYIVLEYAFEEDKSILILPSKFNLLTSQYSEKDIFIYDGYDYNSCEHLALWLNQQSK